MVLSWASLKGAGMPQARSRVSERGFSPSLIQLRLKFLAFSGRFGFSSTYFFNWSESLGRSKNQLADSFITGVLWSRTQYGLIRSFGSSTRPQLSHWSPRAGMQWQYGHSPSTNRSGRNRLSFSQYGRIMFCLKTYPF